MKISNFAIVCRVDKCHGRIIRDDPRDLLRGICMRCGLHTDDWLRINRPKEWAIRQEIDREPKAE